LDTRYNKKFKDLDAALKLLLNPKSKRKPIGYIIPKKDSK